MFQVFLDVRKSYNSLDRAWRMEILWGYGMGHNIARIIAHQWENLQFVPKSRRFLGKVFGTGRVVPQGYPAYPMIFNIVLYAVVRAVLPLVCGSQEAHHGKFWEAG